MNTKNGVHRKKPFDCFWSDSLWSGYPSKCEPLTEVCTHGHFHGGSVAEAFSVPVGSVRLVSLTKEYFLVYTFVFT